MPPRQEVERMQFGPRVLGRVSRAITEVTSLMKSNSEAIRDEIFDTTFSSTEELYRGATTMSFA
jgi:hypothetical protein